MALKIGPKAVVDSLFIAFRKYNVEAEAERLAELPEVRALALSHQDICRHVEQARDRNLGMIRAAKSADITDKFTSLLAAGAESVALFVAPYLELPIDHAEETLELMIKMPALIAFTRRRRHGGKISKILSWEAVSLIPIAGQFVDIFKNNYVHHAYELIRQEALASLMKEYGDASHTESYSN